MLERIRPIGITGQSQTWPNIKWLSQRWLSCLLFIFSTVSAGFAQSTQTIRIVAVTNSADFQPVLPQSGSLASNFLTGLEGAQGITTPTKYPLSNELNGVSVWIDSVPAPILAIAFLDGYQQINVQVPWEHQYNPLNPQSTVEVRQNGIRAQTASTQATVPTSVFFADANGNGIIQHASDYSLVTPQNPAHPGEYLLAYGINLGPVKNQPQTDAPAPFDPLAEAVKASLICGLDRTVQIGTAVVTPSYVGLTPGTVGVYQVNFRLPPSVSVGNLPLSFVWTFGAVGFISAPTVLQRAVVSSCRSGRSTCPVSVSLAGRKTAEGHHRA